ncbi:MAG TPA: ABC transporter ATP-binding protein [Gallionellaceae bacterium]|nr:ABC transporter ATP-binding protein [Gallionellaceae bacterium]
MLTVPLSVSHLSKRYQGRTGPVEAVRDISFAVHAGECFGLLGPNGAGKSTTIQCISGFYPPSSGQVLLNGHDVSREPKLARARLGVCSQEETLDSDFNVLDQLARHARYFRVPRADALALSHRLLDQFGLADKAAEPVESLSGGQRRRLQVARALIAAPAVLVLDEPTVGLDPDARRRLWEILVRQREHGAAILLCTHYMEEAERLCDRVGIIHQGKILDIDTPQHLIARHVPRDVVEEEVRPGVFWKRKPNLEDVYLKLTGSGLGAGNLQ